MVEARKDGDVGRQAREKEQVNNFQERSQQIEQKVADLVVKADPDAEPRDTDYVFITFVMNHLPVGIVGLLLAVIFSAAMSSTSGELNALASTTTVDFYKRNFVRKGSDKGYLSASRWFTLLWGLLAISFATFASMIENLIQAVNILGSIFYGTILGLFVVAFYIKRVQGSAVFYAAVIAELVVLYCLFFTEIAYLHFNFIGCVTVVMLSLIMQFIIDNRRPSINRQ
jgi:Na+/proline symporter